MIDDDDDDAFGRVMGSLRAFFCVFSDAVSFVACVCVHVDLM
jgi:hypothetical protein